MWSQTLMESVVAVYFALMIKEQVLYIMVYHLLDSSNAAFCTSWKFRLNCMLNKSTNDCNRIINEATGIEKISSFSCLGIYTDRLALNCRSLKVQIYCKIGTLAKNNYLKSKISQKFYGTWDIFRK